MWGLLLMIIGRAFLASAQLKCWNCNNADEPDCGNNFKADKILGTSYINCTGSSPACMKIVVSCK